MFTGIVESVGKVTKIEKEGTNYHFTIESELAKEAYIDQSISHNGVCLTVVEVNGDEYTVTAVEETLVVTNLKHWKVGTQVNLERSLLPQTRLDGHFVQGHVDATTTCIGIDEVGGSWYYTFRLPQEHQQLIVSKGSIAINGTSLTVILPDDPSIFKVAIIPYTYENTSFRSLKVEDLVNIEFDILGKYIARQFAIHSPQQS